MTHQTTASGFATDPTMRRLERQLSNLAAAWRGAEDQSVEAAALVQDYHATMDQLIALGWDPAVGELDLEDTLPSNLMPVAYLERHQAVPVDATH